MKTHEVIPGRSIGPFQLGMTRREVEDLDIRPVSPLEKSDGLYFPLIPISESEMARRIGPRPGVMVEFDDQGRCCKIDALFAYKPEPPIFTFRGETLNGMTLEKATDLLRAIADDAEIFYGNVHSASAGFSAGKWERDDVHIMNVTVEPPG